MLYTIGHAPLLSFSKFIANLKKYGINCVVDVRQSPEGLQNGEYEQGILREKLMEHKVWYLPFYEEFGRFNTITIKYNSKAYQKLIASKEFQQGISRLKEGINKGCTIAILGKDTNPVYCFRATILGRYLTSQGWEVNHILDNGNALSQDILEQHIARQQEDKQIINRDISQIGQTGEELASLYLYEHGYRILERNWNLHKGCELDIIAFKDNTLHAVEVKTRTSNSIVAPEQAINDQKLKNIIKALNEYRNLKHLKNINTQIDSIAIVYKNVNDYSINMYENLVRRWKRFY